MGEANSVPTQGDDNTRTDEYVWQVGIDGADDTTRTEDYPSGGGGADDTARTEDYPSGGGGADLIDELEKETRLAARRREVEDQDWHAAEARAVIEHLSERLDSQYKEVAAKLAIHDNLHAQHEQKLSKLEQEAGERDAKDIATRDRLDELSTEQKKLKEDALIAKKLHSAEMAELRQIIAKGVEDRNALMRSMLDLQDQITKIEQGEHGPKHATTENGQLTDLQDQMQQMKSVQGEQGSKLAAMETDVRVLTEKEQNLRTDVEMVKKSKVNKTAMTYQLPPPSPM